MAKVRLQRGEAGTMGERRGEGQRNGGNPLVSGGRGVTTVKNVVVQRIAGLAAQEVDGVHMGGGVARSASRALGGAAGSRDQTRGVSVDVGRTEVAIDLTLAVDYGQDILRTVNRVRDRVSARVEPLTGLKITELNVTVTDIILPEDGESGDAEVEDRTRSLSAPEPAREDAEGGPLAEDQTAELTLDKEGDGERRES